ncbi:MAG: OmpH family outer membrane protein [Deinococcales bacterium]|nr:OmpH family outer membrane protein [Chitinophagaceae bacterium]
MKNFTLGLNVVLAIAIAVLFYLHFSSTKKKIPNTTPATQTNNNNFKIAYFESDSLETGFEYYKQISKELGASEQQKRNELLAQRNAFVEKVKEYQAKGQSMTQMEAAKANQDVEERQKQIQANEQTKSQEIQDERFKKLQDVKKKIEEYLKEYNKNNTFSFILSSSSDLMYYKDSTYDITKDLIKGLNEKYSKKK